jgi:hypothetical protein
VQDTDIGQKDSSNYHDNPSVATSQDILVYGNIQLFTTHEVLELAFIFGYGGMRHVTESTELESAVELVLRNWF